MTKPRLMTMRVPTERATHFRGASIGERERAMRREWIRRIVGLLLLGTILSMVHVWSRVQVLDLRYELSQYQQRTDVLRKEIRQVESQVAALTSVDRLMTIAQEQLGMRSPLASEVVYIQPGGAVTP